MFIKCKINILNENAYRYKFETLRQPVRILGECHLDSLSVDHLPQAQQHVTALTGQRLPIYAFVALPNHYTSHCKQVQRILYKKNAKEIVYV